LERILSSGQKHIGLDCEGPLLGRFGQLSLVQLATEHEVYLLDLVLRRSVRYLEYAHLNRSELPTSDTSSLRHGAKIEAMLAARRSDSAYFKLNHGSLTGAVLDAKDLAEFVDLSIGDTARCRVKSTSECGQFVHLQREGHGNLFFDKKLQEMRRLPSQEEVDASHPQRGSTLYGFGKRRGSRPSVQEDPSSYKEQKSEVIYKKGKRGQVMVRRTGIKLPSKPSGQDWGE